MKFNIDDYKGRYVMHCKTEEEAKDFCVYLDSVGRKWCDDSSYLEFTEWCPHQEGTCYNFNKGSMAEVRFYREHNYTILEWSDFMKEFTKANLKTGDVVKLRDGEVGIVNLELDMCILNERGWVDLSNYDSELINKNAVGCDIVAVRRPTVPCHCQFCAFEHNFGTLVYERKEVEEMTLAEVCKLLGKEIKIIQ